MAFFLLFVPRDVGQGTSPRHAMEISLDFVPTPRRQPRARAGVDPRDPDRLIVPLGGLGCLRLFGLAVTAASAFGLAAGWGDGLSLGNGVASAFAILGGLLVWLRADEVHDRRRLRIDRRWSAPLPFHRSSRALDARRVVVTERTDEHRDSDGDVSYSTVFPVALVTSGKAREEIDAVATWEVAVGLAELFARFLRLPLCDEVSGETRQPEELDLSVGEQLARGRLTLSEVRPAQEMRAKVTDRDGRLRVSVPRPGRRPFVLFGGIAIVAALFFSTPVTLLTVFSEEPGIQLWLAWIPVPLLLGTAVKTSLGYGAEIEASDDGLRIRSRGLVLRRSVEIPAAELEDLEVLRPERGGPRDALYMAFDGLLVARSDFAAVRFGHGLETGELQWLRSCLLGRVGSAAARAPRRQSRPRALPLAPEPAWTLGGLLAGALLGHLVGGPLAVCVDAPFFENVFNVGALLGVIAARLARTEMRRLPPGNSALAYLLSPLALLGVLALLLDPSSPATSAGPRWDELSFLRRGPSGLGLWFYSGWILLVTVAGGVAGSLLLTPVFALRRRVRGR